MNPRELLGYIIAYNLLRALINHGKSAGAESASFKGTIDRLNHWLPIVFNAPSARLRKQLVTDLTELIAEDQVSTRPFRRRPKPHQLLNVPLHQMIKSWTLTSYTYSEDTAKAIAQSIRGAYLPEFVKLQECLDTLTDRASGSGILPPTGTRSAPNDSVRMNKAETV